MWLWTFFGLNVPIGSLSFFVYMKIAFSKKKKKYIYIYIYMKIEFTYKKLLIK